MSTPAQVDELATLRQTVAELTAKNASRKARIAELESLLATAQNAMQTTQAELTRIQVTEPMRVLSEAISPTAELFLSELARVGYSVVHKDGRLALMRDGKVVEGTDVTADGMRKLLLSDDPAHKNMPHLLILSKASGGGAIGQSQSMGSQPVGHADKTERAKPPQFGLR